MRVNPAVLNGGPLSKVNTRGSGASARAEGALGRAVRSRRLDGCWGCPVCPADMQDCRFEVHLIPAQRHQLRGPQAAPIGVQDRRGAAVPSAVIAGRL